MLYYYKAKLVLDLEKKKQCLCPLVGKENYLTRYVDPKANIIKINIIIFPKGVNNRGNLGTQKSKSCLIPFHVSIMKGHSKEEVEYSRKTNNIIIKIK